MLITQQFHFPCVGVFGDKVCVCVVCVRTRKEGLTECYPSYSGFTATQPVPLVDKYVPTMCLFIGLQILRASSKSFYWMISQVRFLSLKSQALTKPPNLGIIRQAGSSLPVPSSGPLCSVEGFKYPAQH